jgi:hypothetical protein
VSVSAKSNLVQNCVSDTEFRTNFTSVYGYFIMEKQILSGRPSNEQVGGINGRETPVMYSCDDAVQVSTQYQQQMDSLTKRLRA